MNRRVWGPGLGLAVALGIVTSLTAGSNVGTSASAAAPPQLTHVGIHGSPSSLIGSETTKFAIVNCPAGQRVLGGGARLVNRSTTPFYGRVVLTQMKPVSSRDGAGQYHDTYYAIAQELTGGFAGNWSLHVSAVCADHNPANRLQIVEETDSSIIQDWLNPRIRASHASCPTGTKVVGTGASLLATVTGGTVGASLQQVRPNQQGRYVYVEGISSPPTSNLAFTGLHSTAVCAHADLGQHVVIDGTEPSDDRAQSWPVRCASGEEVTGAGMTKGDATGLAHVEEIVPVASSRDKVSVAGSAVPADPEPWNIAAWAVCVP